MLRRAHPGLVRGGTARLGSGRGGNRAILSSCMHVRHVGLGGRSREPLKPCFAGHSPSLLRLRHSGNWNSPLLPVEYRENRAAVASILAHCPPLASASTASVSCWWVWASRSAASWAASALLARPAITKPPRPQRDRFARRGGPARQAVRVLT